MGAALQMLPNLTNVIAVICSDPEMLGFVNKLLITPRYNKHFGCFFFLKFVKSTCLIQQTLNNITNKFPQSLGTTFNRFNRGSTEN